jgi:hypothetical protein
MNKQLLIVAAFCIIAGLAEGAGRALDSSSPISTFFLASCAIILALSSMVFSGWCGLWIYTKARAIERTEKAAFILSIVALITIFLLLDFGLHSIPGIGQEVAAFYDRPSQH